MNQKVTNINQSKLVDREIARYRHAVKARYSHTLTGMTIKIIHDTYAGQTNLSKYGAMSLNHVDRILDIVEKKRQAYFEDSFSTTIDTAHIDDLLKRMVTWEKEHDGHKSYRAMITNLMYIGSVHDLVLSYVPKSDKTDAMKATYEEVFYRVYGLGDLYRLYNDNWDITKQEQTAQKMGQVFETVESVMRFEKAKYNQLELFEDTNLAGAGAWRVDKIQDGGVALVQDRSYTFKQQFKIEGGQK